MKKRECYLSKEARQKGLDKCREVAIQKRLNRITEYNTNPNLCSFCKKALSYEKRKNKYCSHSCSATKNNLGIKRNYIHGKFEKKTCINCGHETENSKYCSNDCLSEYKWEQRKKKIEELGCIFQRSDKRYLIETRGHKCEICKTTEWQKQPIPLQTDHIDGDSDNNDLKNVRIICPNCHALTDTYCGKNIGNGRWTKKQQYRKKRYDKGLSY